MLIEDLRLEDFSGSIGEGFQIDGEEADLTLLLEEAAALPPSIRASGSFRLVFRGPHTPILPQGIHRLRRGEASFDIFIVPLQPDGAGVRYEAIFN